jgi:hypothetical protein
MPSKVSLSRPSSQLSARYLESLNYHCRTSITEFFCSIYMTCTIIICIQGNDSVRQQRLNFSDITNWYFRRTKTDIHEDDTFRNSRMTPFQSRHPNLTILAVNICAHMKLEEPCKCSVYSSKKYRNSGINISNC